MPWDRTQEPSDADRRHANIPNRSWGGSLSKIDDRFPYKVVIGKYLDGLEANLKDGIGLLLWGPYRSGKSSIAGMIAHASIRHFASVYFVEAALLIDGWLGKSDASLKSRMLGVHLLIIDDVGQEHGKEYTRAMMDFVVRYRAEHRRATILTTNLTMAQLEKEYGEKFIAIAKTCLYPVQIEGKDWGKDEWDKVRGRFE